MSSHRLQVILFFLSKIFLPFAPSPLSQTESFFKCHLFFAHVLKKEANCVHLLQKWNCLELVLTCKPENSGFFGTRELGCRKSAHSARYVTFVPTLFDGTSTRPLHFCPGLDTQFVVDTQAHTHSLWFAFAL